MKRAEKGRAAAIRAAAANLSYYSILARIDRRSFYYALRTAARFRRQLRALGAWPIPDQYKESK